MAEFLYELDSKEKIDCVNPNCGKHNCFVRYKNTSTGRYLEGDYGRCDHENSCGYHKKPEGNKRLILNKSVDEIVSSYLDCDHIPDVIYEPFHKNILKIPNPLLRGLTKKYGRKKVMEAYDKYNLGTYYDGATMFPYIGYGLHTAKIIWYGEDMHRIRVGRGCYPQWLHNSRYTDKNGQIYISDFEGKRPIPLFGTHLMLDFDKEKLVCIVEGEKTAVVMSMKYPDYIWVATGGLRMLNKWKFTRFQYTKVLIFPDMGIVKEENISVRDLWNIKINEATEVADFRYAFVNYVPYFMPTILKEKWEDDGKDILDFMFHYENEWLKDGFKSYEDYFNLMLSEAIKRI